MKERGASWKAEYDRFAELLQERSYESRIVKAYTKWVRKFQAFTRSKPPELLSSEDVRAFLASLTTKRRMTVSKQNQVYDALLLLYRHVLNQTFDIDRPSRSLASGSPGKKMGSSHQAVATGAHAGRGASCHRTRKSTLRRLRRRRGHEAVVMGICPREPQLP